jgi:hypothetical protein
LDSLEQGKHLERIAEISNSIMEFEKIYKYAKDSKKINDRSGERTCASRASG